MNNSRIVSVFLIISFIFSCGPKKELTRTEVDKILNNNKNSLLDMMVERPGGLDYKIGKSGGVWKTTLASEPTTFNIVRINDLPTSQLMSNLMPYLLEYNPYKKEWTGNVVDYEIKVFEKEDRLDVIFTIKDNVFWYIPKDDKKIEVLADDVVFWFEKMIKMRELSMSEYAGVFVKMKNGEEKEIVAEKIGLKKFVFHYPRIVAEPLLSSNMQFAPKFLYEEFVEKKDVSSILNILSINSDVKTIPTMGPFFIESYRQGVELVLKKNPYYHKYDLSGNKLPYIDKIQYQFVSNPSTKLMLFKQGELDTYYILPEDLDSLLSQKKSDFYIINGGASLSASFISWNQNKKAMQSKYYNWFSKKEFRQAMSCFFDRDRIIDKVYRGLAKPANFLFCSASQFYDENIIFEYMFNVDKGVELLKKIGIEKKGDGFCYDSENNRVEFDLFITGDNAISVDIANIYSDELKNQGITLNIRVVDFNKIVDSLLYTFDWHSVMMGFSGSNIFPTSGSNVWQSTGNLHIWHPQQKAPATEWEREIDYLYNEGAYTVEKESAKKIWDRYQSIILEQVPLMYMVLPYQFIAVQKKWGNITFDYLESIDIDYVYLK